MTETPEDPRAEPLGVTGPEIREWIDTLTAEQIMTGLSKAIQARDWLAIEGLMKMLAIKDPKSAQTVYDTMLAVMARKEG